jgi:membrane protein DedA with SNARE-associated domain
MTPMPYRTFMAWTTPACIIWAFLYVSIGSGAAETFRGLEESVSWAGWIFVGIFAIGIGLAALGKHLLRRYSDIDHDPTEGATKK